MPVRVRVCGAGAGPPTGDTKLSALGVTVIAGGPVTIRVTATVAAPDEPVAFMVMFPP